MTQKEFIEILEDEGYSYEMSGDKIIVNYKGNVYLNDITSISPGVVFINGEGVFLSSLTSLPSGVEFRNVSYVNLSSLTSLPPGMEFRNVEGVDLGSLTSIPSSVEFKNGRNVDLSALIGDWFSDWKGNIEGIDPNRLLNFMISKGLFER